MNTPHESPASREAGSRTRPRVGSVAWERAGGPPLSFGQRLGALGSAGVVVVSHYAQKLWWRLGHSGLLPARRLQKVDLAAWAPPDSRAARNAESFLREVSSPQMVSHSLRTYYFSGVVYELASIKPPLDRETLYVAALMHDVGLFQSSPSPSEHCFTVGGAREARLIASEAGWDESRQDRMAVAITANLNSFVPSKHFGAEAHFMRVGGLVEVLAQEWKLHPDNLAEILGRYPRAGFAADALQHVQREVKRHPNCRFACLDPLFPILVRRSSFSLDIH